VLRSARGFDAHILPVSGTLHRKLDHAFIQREERKVLANTNTLTGVKAGATLAYDDAAPG